MFTNEILMHWKAYDINLKVGFFLGVPFSLACTRICISMIINVTNYIDLETILSIVLPLSVTNHNRLFDFLMHSLTP